MAQALGKVCGIICGFLIIVVVIVLAVTLGVIFGLKKTHSDSPTPSDSPTSSTTVAPAAATDTFDNAAVAADAGNCSHVGVNILKKNGSAVDAAIASLLCVGVINMHSTGIGGGGYLVYYNATSKTATVFDYRETAPARAVYTDDKRGELKMVAAVTNGFYLLVKI